MNIDKMLTPEESRELIAEGFAPIRPSHPYGEIPDWMKEAMEKAGVIRDENGKFVKVK